MRYLSVCSGIEAASVAWKHLGWNAVAFSEIEAFPSKVLAHHYPDVPNLGDMTLLTKNEYLNGQQIDLLVGGTPCQSFSVAGLRAGLADERGNLSLEYIRLLEHKRPKWFLWENVPGVLSSNGGADFASILSGWTGRDIAPQRFEISGIIEGSFYSVAWRVLDSRYFGVPQRRRRIFVVGYLGGDWRPSTAVLFERESLSRDFTPSRSKRKKSTTSAERGSGAGNQVWPADVASTLNTKFGDKMGLDNQHINEGAPLFVPIPAYGIQANIVNRTEKSGANGLGVKEEESFTLTKGDKHCVMQPASYTLGGFGGYNEGVGTLKKSGGDLGGGSENIVVQPTKCYFDDRRQGLEINTEIAPTVIKHWGNSPHNIPFVQQPIVLDDQGGNVMTVYDQGYTGTLRAQTHGYDPIVLQLPFAWSQNQVGDLITGEVMHTLNTNSNATGRNAPNIMQHSMVRRLTPLECERLQGFPDGYSAIPGASDSKRYAALGNSMTVNVMKWIGERIDKVDKLIKTL